MFDFAWSELALIGFLSVMLLGPKQLPETMRTLAKVMRKLRSLSSEFQGHVNEMMREAELDELRDQVKKLSTTSLSDHVEKMVDPTGEIKGSLQLDPAAGSSTPAATSELVADPAAPAVANEAAPVAAPPAPAPAPKPPASPAPPAAPIDEGFAS